MGFFSTPISRHFKMRLNFSLRKSLSLSLLLLTLLMLLAFFIGPLFPADPAQRFSFISRLPDPSQNSLVPIIAGAEEISYPAQGTSSSLKKFSFAYLHGFSASRQEISPVAEDIAKYFAAPAFFVRLAGHGIHDQGESLGQAQCLDWLKDSDRAVTQASIPGRDLVIIATSFGGLLASFAALEHPDQIKALVLISPLFDTADPRAKWLSGPLGPFWARLLIGTTREYPTQNEMQRRLSTYHYPSRVIPQLMDCVNFIRQADLSKIKIPLLVFYTEKDRVVSVAEIKKRFAEFGSSKKKLVEVAQASQHVLTGQMIEPTTIPFVEDQIEKFLETL